MACQQDHKEEIAAAKIEASKAKKQRVLSDAKKAVEGLAAAKKVKIVDSGLSTVFHTCIERIFQHLVADMEPNPQVWKPFDPGT